MLKKYLMIALVLFLLILTTISSTLAIVFYINSNSLKAEITRLESEVADLKAAQQNPSPTPSVSVTPALDCFNQSTDGWIRITNPCSNEKITSPLTISGRSKGVFEGTVNIEILDSAGNKIDEGFVTLGNSINTELEDFGPVQFEFDVPAALREGKLKIFAVSAKDGSELHTVIIDVKF